MKELNELSAWTDSIINEFVKPNTAKKQSPIELKRDIKTQAQHKYPSYEPDDALSLFIADKLEDMEKFKQEAEKRDREQNRVITQQGKLIHDQDESESAMIDRINALSKYQEVRTRKEAEHDLKLSQMEKIVSTQKQQTSPMDASDNRIDALMREIDNLKTKNGISSTEYQHLKSEVNKIATSPNFDESKFNALRAEIDKLSGEGSVSDAELRAAEKTMNNLSKNSIDMKSYLYNLNNKIQKIYVNQQKLQKEIDVISNYANDHTANINQRNQRNQGNQGNQGNQQSLYDFPDMNESIFEDTRGERQQTVNQIMQTKFYNDTNIIKYYMFVSRHIDRILDRENDIEKKEWKQMIEYFMNLDDTAKNFEPESEFAKRMLVHFKKSIVSVLNGIPDPSYQVLGYENTVVDLWDMFVYKSNTDVTNENYRRVQQNLNQVLDKLMALTRGSSSPFANFQQFRDTDIRRALLNAIKHYSNFYNLNLNRLPRISRFILDYAHQELLQTINYDRDVYEVKLPNKVNVEINSLAENILGPQHAKYLK